MTHLTLDDVALTREDIGTSQFHQLQRGEDRGQWVPQFVAEHGEEFVLPAACLTQLVGESSTLRHVPGDFRGADDLTVTIPDGRNRHRDVDECATLSATNGFKVIDDLPAPDAFQNVAFL